MLFSTAFIASGFDFSKLNTANYETNSYTLNGNFETIEIRTDEAAVTFQPSEDGKTRVVCVEREKVRHEVFIENASLKILAADRRAWYDFLFLFSLGDAEITVSTGDVTFDASSDGGLKISTSTGDIHMNRVQAESIDLSVSTGRIEGRDIDCKETLSVKVSTGKTDLTDVACKVLRSTGTTGAVTLKNVVATEDFRIERDTGDVRFESCDAGQISVKTSTGNVTGTLCSEKVFVTKTSTGKVNVPDSVSGGRCEITTSTGNIRISTESLSEFKQP